MNPVLIVHHAPSEGPGTFAEWLDARSWQVGFSAS